MKKQILLISLLISIFFGAFAQPITTGTPEAAGFSSERLKRLDAAMDEWVKKGYMNGGAALIIRNGKIAYYKASGYDDLDTKSTLQKDGIFRIDRSSACMGSVKRNSC